MGRRIDRAAAFALVCLIAYAFFRHCVENRLAALLFSGALVLCLRRLLAFPLQKAAKRSARRVRARRIVDSWPFRSAEEGGAEALMILEKVRGLKPGEWEFVFLPYHSSKTLSPEDVLSQRRKHAGSLVLACACPASGAARAAAAACGPEPVRLFDRQDLLRMARKCDDLPEPKRYGNASFRFALLLGRVRPLRCAACGMVSLAVYVLTGSLSSLLAGILLLLLWALTRLRPQIP